MGMNRDLQYQQNHCLLESGTTLYQHTWCTEHNTKPELALTLLTARTLTLPQSIQDRASKEKKWPKSFIFNASNTIWRAGLKAESVDMFFTCLQHSLWDATTHRVFIVTRSKEHSSWWLLAQELELLNDQGISFFLSPFKTSSCWIRCLQSKSTIPKELLCASGHLWAYQEATGLGDRLPCIHPNTDLTTWEL